MTLQAMCSRAASPGGAALCCLHAHTCAPFPEVTQAGNSSEQATQATQATPSRPVTCMCVGPHSRHLHIRSCMLIPPTRQQPRTPGLKPTCVWRVLSPCSSCVVAPKHAGQRPALDRSAAAERPCWRPVVCLPAPHPAVPCKQSPKPISGTQVLFYLRKRVI